MKRKKEHKGNDQSLKRKAVVGGRAIQAEPLNGLELFAPLFLSREKGENIPSPPLTNKKPPSPPSTKYHPPPNDDLPPNTTFPQIRPSTKYDLPLNNEYNSDDEYTQM